MLRACMMTVFALIIMNSPAAFAQKVIKLSPKESKSLTNNYLWTINATCNIQGSQISSKILVSVEENKGQVNGKNLSKGQATSVSVKNNDHISVSAEPGAIVTLINLGDDSVQAVCS
jgi:hypothetical protein